MLYFHQLCYLLSLTLCVAFALPFIVELPNGKIQSAVFKDYYSFTNIPYAEPPTRFEPSTPYERSWTDVRNATGQPLSCVQFVKMAHTDYGQEDCLYLNVFVPKVANDVHLLPVFVFIHGGGFMYGSSGFYSPQTIMPKKNMIVVTPNYRLGPFGFLSTGDNIIHGNLGLKDQLLALRWIKQNIRQFGGDPEKILLTGSSAGGASVHFQMMRKEAESLISAAAPISGTPLNPWVMQKRPTEKLEILSHHLSCPHMGEELKSCLQNRSVEVFREAVLKMLTFNDNPFNLFGPVIESVDAPDAFLTKEPRTLIKEGATANIPWMASFTTEEGAFNAASLLDKDEKGVDLIEELNDRWFELAPSLLFYYDEPSDQLKHSLSEKLRQKYMGDLPFSRDNYRKLQRMFSDVLFVNGIRETIDLYRKYGHSAIYGYVYGNPHSYGVGNYFSNDFDYQFGATHGDDLEMFLPLTDEVSPHKGVERTNDASISRHMIEMFSTFILEGFPRFGNTSLPKNENFDQPMQYLQILERNYCTGPWNDDGSSHCQACVCYVYDSSADLK